MKTFQINRILIVLKLWLPLAATIVIMSGLVYVATQQSYRTAADDPQIQLAEDAAAALTAGQQAQAMVPETAAKTDAAKSLAAFIIILDKDGKVLASTMNVDGQTPVPPAGVLSYVDQHGENRLTWQPKSGVRIAAVITKFTGSQTGYVLVGRSLREVEVREDSLTLEVGLACITALVVSLALTLFGAAALSGRSGKAEDGAAQSIE